MFSLSGAWLKRKYLNRGSLNERGRICVSECIVGTVFVSVVGKVQLYLTSFPCLFEFSFPELARLFFFERIYYFSLIKVHYLLSLTKRDNA